MASEKFCDIPDEEIIKAVVAEANARVKEARIKRAQTTTIVDVFPELVRLRREMERAQ